MGDIEKKRRAAYGQRLEARRATLGAHARRASLLSNLRLLAFVVGVVTAWFALGTRSIDSLWLTLPVLAFVALLIVHDRVLRARARSSRAVTLYERGIARMEDHWIDAEGSEGVSGDERDYAEHDHPFAADLDLFGRGSLYALLSGARTRDGEETLARWLLAPAKPEVIRERQQAVEELAEGLDLREDISILGDELRAELRADSLRAWGEGRQGSRTPVSRGVRIAALALPVSSTLAFGSWLWLSAAPYWCVMSLALQTAFALRYRGRVRSEISAVELPSRELALFSEILGRLEAERFSSPLLARLRSSLESKGMRPSRRVARLVRLTDLLDARRNQFFAPMGALLLWTTQLAFAIEAWRADCGPEIATWFSTTGEIEALSALAAYAYEHPDYSFPEIVEGGPLFEAEGLGHPLLPADRRVCNDIHLENEPCVLVVSGSNMSGKSTMLRSIGTNGVLALAGAPVCAKKLRLSALSIGASIRLQDSLLEGSSRFYAEIQRLRQIVDLTRGELPVLYLLDEILHGTNSHDRGIGAEAIVRSLVERGAIGLVTTHDLALARVAEEFGNRGKNVHFQDHLEDGVVVFDYHMRPGVVTKSNALELMRSVGLEV